MRWRQQNLTNPGTINHVVFWRAKIAQSVTASRQSTQTFIIISTTQPTNKDTVCLVHLLLTA